MISALERIDCQAHVFCCDIGNEERLHAVIKEIQTGLPPIRGCINYSVRWADSVFENMTHEGWQTSIKQKV
jgi:hypothetical protein